METKRCRKCSIEKPLDQFYSTRDRRGGTHPRNDCKACKDQAARDRKKRREEGKQRTWLRQRRGETYRNFQYRVIADAWRRAQERAQKAGRQ